MPATFSTVSRRLFRRRRSVLKPHLSLNRKPNTAEDEREEASRKDGKKKRRNRRNTETEMATEIKWKYNSCSLIALLRPLQISAVTFAVGIRAAT